jgi:four helix bundle protein
MNKEELKTRTKVFAHRCVKPALSLPKSILGRHISGQLIRCSTSVASNYLAVCIAQSRATFISKLAIVIEEADETAFWIVFLIEENLVKISRVADLLKEAGQLTAIFVASQQTARKNLKKS